MNSHKLRSLHRKIAQMELPFEQALRLYRRLAILERLEAHDWNVCETARDLGMHRNTLSRQMQELGLERPVPYSRKPMVKVPASATERTA